MKKTLIGLFGLLMISALSGCQSTSTTTDTDTDTDTPGTIEALSGDTGVDTLVKEIEALILDEDDSEGSGDAGEIDASTDAEMIAGFFEADALVEDISIVDCTLSDGTETTCYNVVTTLGVTEDDIGPRCPKNIADSAEEGGMWLEDGKAYDVDGEFIKNLDTFYDDDTWKMYDEETGDIFYTETKEACEAAARPDVDEEYQNHCVECLLSFVDEIPTVTYIIPTNPIQADESQSLNRLNPIGIAFNGVRFDAPAPTEAILAAHTLAAFDDCGGHVNPNVGYHYHAETGCAPRVEEDESHGGVIGFALDGFKIHEHDDTIVDDLDTCGGHDDETLGYHYHIADAGANQFLGCFSGGYGCVLTEDGTCDASASTDRRGPPPGE